MVQKDELVKLVYRLEGWNMEIQSNGVVGLAQKILDLLSNVKFSVTPKPSAAGNRGEYVRSEYIPRASGFKFLVEAPGELGEVDRFVQFFNIEPSKVYLRPRCASLADHISKITWLTHYAKSKGYSVTPRFPCLKASS